MSASEVGGKAQYDSIMQAVQREAAARLAEKQTTDPNAGSIDQLPPDPKTQGTPDPNQTGGTHAPALGTPTAPKQRKPPVATTPKPAATHVSVVKAKNGETLQTLSKKYGIPITTLMKLNPGLKRNNGQWLVYSGSTIHLGSGRMPKIVDKGGGAVKSGTRKVYNPYAALSGNVNASTGDRVRAGYRAETKTFSPGARGGQRDKPYVAPKKPPAAKVAIKKAASVVTKAKAKAKAATTYKPTKSSGSSSSSGNSVTTTKGSSSSGSSSSSTTKTTTSTTNPYLKQAVDAVAAELNLIRPLRTRRQHMTRVRLRLRIEPDSHQANYPRSTVPLQQP